MPKSEDPIFFFLIHPFSPPSGKYTENIRRENGENRGRETSSSKVWAGKLS